VLSIDELDAVYFNNDSKVLLSALRQFPIAAFLAYKTVVTKAIDDIKPGDSFNADIFKTYSDNFSGIINITLSGDKYALKRSELLLNVNRFAAYKTHHATTQIARQWADKDAVAREPKQYKEAAKRVANKFNRYQVAEYNTATARARTAKQWIDFTSDETRMELYPNLKWLPSRSVEQRPEHVEFYGTIRPKNDPFWNENQPGNLWQCKCDWEETDEGSTGTPKRKASAQQGLEGNPGEEYKYEHGQHSGVIFTNNSVYFKAKPAATVESAILNAPETGWFNVNPKVKCHVLHGQNEIAGNMQVLDAFVATRNNVKSIKLLPNITGDNLKLKPNFYPEGFTSRGKASNADAVITFDNGDTWVADIKAMKGTGSKLNHRLNDAYQQADFAIIKILGVEHKSVQQTAETFIKKHPMFKGLIIINNSNTVIYEFIRQ